MNFIKVKVSHAFLNELFCQFNQTMLRKPQVIKRSVKRYLSCWINFLNSLEHESRLADTSLALNPYQRLTPIYLIIYKPVNVGFDF